MLTCNPMKVGPVMRVNVLHSNNHEETLPHATGIVKLGYNEGRGPFIQHFFKVDEVEALQSIPPEEAVGRIAQGIQQYLTQAGLSSLRCRTIVFLTELLPWGSFTLTV